MKHGQNESSSEAMRAFETSESSFICDRLLANNISNGEWSIVCSIETLTLMLSPAIPVLYRLGGEPSGGLARVSLRLCSRHSGAEDYNVDASPRASTANKGTTRPITTLHTTVTCGLHRQEQACQTI